MDSTHIEIEPSFNLLTNFPLSWDFETRSKKAQEIANITGLNWYFLLFGEPYYFTPEPYDGDDEAIKIGWHNSAMKD